MTGSSLCDLSGSSESQRRGAALLHHGEQRCGRGVLRVPGLRPQRPALQLHLCAVPTRTLHRHAHQPVHGVSAQHVPCLSRHAGPRRLQTLRARQQER